MHRIGSRERMTRKYGLGIPLGWHARIWLVRRVLQRRPIGSEEFMRRIEMLLTAALVTLAGCKRNAEPDSTLFVSGRIDGDTVDISSKIPGRIVDLKVREGDTVEAGQVVA